MSKVYGVGEIVLMEHNGWLKAFKVVGVRQVSDDEVCYELALMESKSQWERPAR